jgi:membrane-anchored glycerophosphoryl diester phosphodiesterase (GDPDase)
MKKEPEKGKKSILEQARERLDMTLILFELVLSVIFSLVGHLIGSMYLRGIGVGLVIAWVTSAIAYFRVSFYRKKKVKE